MPEGYDHMHTDMPIPRADPANPVMQWCEDCQQNTTDCPDCLGCPRCGDHADCDLY